MTDFDPSEGIFTAQSNTFVEISVRLNKLDYPQMRLQKINVYK